MREITDGMAKALNESLARHNQYEINKKIIDFIMKNIIPMYEKYPYMQRNDIRQMEKLLTVDKVFSYCHGIQSEYDESVLLLGVVLEDIGYVAEEFVYPYRIPGNGAKKWAEFVKAHSDEINDLIGLSFKGPYNPIMDALIPSDKGNLQNRKYKINPYRVLIHDIETLAWVTHHSPEGMAYIYATDMVSDGEGSMEETYEHAVNMIKCKFGPNGTKKIANRYIFETPELYNEYIRFSNQVALMSTDWNNGRMKL